jgi:hypothetical protein
MSVTFFVALGILTVGDIAARMKAEPKTVAEFTEAYKRYGLWLPPKDAKLVRWEKNKVWSGSKEPYQERIVHVRLRIRPKSQSQPAFLRERDYEFTEHRESRLKIVPPTMDQLVGVDLHFAEDWLAFAAQAHHLGWNDLAKAAFERGRIETGNRQDPDDVKNNPCHALTMLRRQAWRHYYDSLHESETDLAASYVMLKRISDDDVEFRGEYQRQLLTDLDKSICERRVPKNGVERHIDALCDLSHTLLRDRTRTSKTAYDELAQLGFEAVPALIRHLDDTRTTRIAKLEGFNNGLWIDTQRVGSICRELLEKLSDREFDPDDEDTPAEVQRQAEKWFARAKTVGEEKWAVDRAVDANGTNDVLLRLLARKYPKRFDELFRDVLKNRPEWHIDAFTTALIRSGRPRNEQVALLKEALATNRPHAQYGAVRVLRELDFQLYRTSLRSLLENLALEKDEKLTQWFYLIDMVEESGDPDCWTGYTKVLKRLSPNNRIETCWHILSQIEYRSLAEIQNRLVVIEALWNDATIRNYEDVGHFPFASSEYQKLSVRDGVTLAVADQLDIDVPWKPDRTPEEWKVLRQKVQTALAEARKQWAIAPMKP